MERRGAISGDYLHRCRDLHARVTEIRYGRTQNLAGIEEAAAGIRSSRRLTYDDIEGIRDGRIWNADTFGYWPPRDEIESILESQEWDFWNLPRKEDEAISGLLRVFRQIEPVSVVLRFIVPKHYGIMSPPVEKVLGPGPFRRHPERYRIYLNNLRKIRDDRGFDTVAEVDMALWTLQLGVLDEMLADHLPKVEYEALWDGFRQDSKLREIRVGNLTRQIFSDMTRGELSEALLATNSELAGQIAAIEFERSVKRMVGAKPGDKESLRKLVDDVLPDRIREALRDRDESGRLIIECKEAVSTRNKVIHPERTWRKEEIVKLIQTMNKINEMEETRCRRSGVSDLKRPRGGSDQPPALPEEFQPGSTIDELAFDQGIVAPQQIGKLIGAGADLWNDEEDFRNFVEGIHERRLEGRRRHRGDG